MKASISPIEHPGILKIRIIKDEYIFEEWELE
jgi:hypothetical protein